MATILHFRVARAQPARSRRPETRRHVREAVAQLADKPDVAARSPRTFKAAKILVTVPDISNPFFASVIRSAEGAAREADLPR